MLPEEARIADHQRRRFNERVDVFGCMATLGQWQGSELVIPQFGLAVNYQPGDLLLGDVHLWHGNAPFVEGGERVTTVLYCRERMHECGSDSGEDNR
jgi:hypothetical protein